MHKINRGHLYMALVFAFFLQLTLTDYMAIFGARPDLPIICVVFFAFFCGERIGIEAGIAAGILEDIFSSGRFGTNVLIMGVTGTLVGYLNEKFVRESKITQTAFVFFACFFSMTVRYYFESLFSGGAQFGFYEYMSTSIAGSSAYSALVSIPVFSKFISLYKVRSDEGFL